MKKIKTFVTVIWCVLIIFGMMFAYTGGSVEERLYGIAVMLVGLIVIALPILFGLDYFLSEQRRESIELELEFNVSADQSTFATDTSAYMGRWKDEPVHRPN